jgi:secondary thiamine-phosphate synthase enzyme
MQMKGYKTINIKTGRYVQLIDVTGQVRQYVSETGIKDGIIVIFTPHTTAGITINENADPAVTHDIEAFLQKKIPHENYFEHSEGNSPSHIMSSYISASETLIIDGGELLLGTWQAIYFCEFDGPRNRRFHLKIIGDKE